MVVLRCKTIVSIVNLHIVADLGGEITLLSQDPLAEKIKILEQKLLESEERYRAELKRTEEEKKRIEMLVIRACRLSAMGDLTAGVAHEINNPLSGIMLKAEILKFEFEEGSENFGELERILELSKRIAKIVKELSLFTKREEGVRVKLKVVDALQHSLSLLSNRINKNGIIVTQNIEERLPLVYAQSQDLQQLFVNLINNSRLALNDKFGETPNQEKKITITGKTKSQNGKDVVIISIRDEGIGISKENLDRVFDLFFSTRRSCEGIGTGLNICQKIMQEHQGKIYLKSEEGSHTIVTLEFPAASFKTATTEKQSI